MRPALRTLSVAALALACAVPAHAGRDDGFRGHGGHGRHGYPGVHHGGGHHGGHHGGHFHGHRGYHGGHHHGGHHHSGRSWAPWVVGGLIGAAIIGAANPQAAPAPAPVVVSTVPVVPLGAAPAVVTVPSPLLPMPPVASHQLPTPPAPPLTVSVPQPVPPRVHFYCVPAQAYFPTVGSCPVPWQVVPY